MKHLLNISLLLLLAILIPAIAAADDFEFDGIYYAINGTEAYVSNNSLRDISGDITIPDSISYNGITYPVTAISDWAFHGCDQLTGISFGNSINYIGEFSFECCNKLSYINLSESVKTIGDCAFGFCTSLKNLTIPNSVTTIRDSAFSGCSKLTSISIGNSLIFTDYVSWFYGCNSLEHITVASDHPNYDSRDNCNAIIATATNKLILGCKNTTIPNTVTSIGGCAFESLTSLTSIIIPNSVTELECGAFEFCDNLSNVIIPNSVTSMDDAFWECEKLSSIFLTGEGGWQAGELPDNISTLNIDDSITSVAGLKVKPTDIFCFATNPPTCDNNSFTDYSGTLHVPATSLAAYFTAPYWCNFNLVGDAVKANNISMDHNNITMLIGDETTLTAVITPENASSNIITWASSNPAVATVVNGVVMAKAFGECDIFAMCLDHKDTCHVVVYKDRLTFDQQEAQVLPNHILTLTPTSLANQLPSLVVSSSDATVAAARLLNGKVQVVGIKEGTATITVSVANGTAEPATCLVTVYTERGDMNVDGYVNIADVTTLIDYLLSGDEESINKRNADVNQDGRISIGDVTALIDLLLSGGN